MPFLLSDLLANVQKLENVVNKQTDQMDEQVAEWYYYVSLNLVRDKNVVTNKYSKMSKNNILWFCDVTFDLEKLVSSGHYHYKCVFQIWEQYIQWFISYSH